MPLVVEVDVLPVEPLVEPVPDVDETVLPPVVGVLLFEVVPDDVVDVDSVITVDPAVVPTFGSVPSVEPLAPDPGIVVVGSMDDPEAPLEVDPLELVSPVPVDEPLVLPVELF